MPNKNENELLKQIEELKKEIKKLKSRKKYGLVWEEKEEQVVLDCQNKLPILKEVKSKAINTDKDKPVNILIEGDNYHSLSVLNYTHKEKIDVIYIDPPYNRGTNDFKYNDRYIDEEDTYRHSKWLSFINKRLRLAYNLLKTDGTLFISIDDNEYANLKLLCDDIFGEKMVETYIWCLQDKTEGSFVKTSKNTVRKEHEYLLACFKSQIKFKKYKTEKLFSDGSFANPDNDPKGAWFSGNISRNGIKTTTGSKYYTITTPTGVKYARNWTLSKEEFEDLLAKGEIYFSKNGGGVPRQKIYQSSDTYSIQSSLFTDVHTSITGKNELKELFNGESPFDFPKPSTLIKRLIEISPSNKNCVVLDFFAGTGTTGQAVLNLNKNDGGKRSFVLCTNNENNISEDICYPRIERIIKGYKNSKENKTQGLGGNLKYYKTAFVDTEHIRKISDESKIKLSYQVGDMIALRENVLDEVEKNDWWQIFSDDYKTLAIYFKEDKSKLSKLVSKLNKENKKVILYIFSWGKNEYKNEFSDYKNIRVEDIPEPILEVYKEINKL